ncbi:MAG: hypothetical protein ACRYFW_06630 [Janthinobacterium lividum]
MRTLFIAAAAAAASVAVPALAQDAAPATPTDTTSASRDAMQTGSAPDGSRAFGIVPYFGVMGGWESFDNQANRSGVPQNLNANGTKGRQLNGSLVEGVAGINIPVGPLFVGVEGNVAKGVTGDIDWEYGGAGRAGVRAGDSGLIYGKVGYQWVNFNRLANTSRDYNDMEYGIGFEVGPKDIGLGGLTNRAGLRLRGEMSTFGAAHSWRPMAGIIAHF